MDPNAERMNLASRWMACKAVGLIAANFAMTAGAAPAQSGPQAAPDDLEPILVTAQRAPVQRMIDRRVYDVTTDLQSATGTAADILNDIPSVEVDADGIVSLRGDSNVTILIDGKPSAQLTGAAAGVINIITKKPRQSASSGTVRASVGNDRRNCAWTTHCRCRRIAL
jgi:outer membrane cobalamin receptor